MHTTQRQCVLEQKPTAICREQVAHLMNMDKSAVDGLIDQLVVLRTHYVVYCAILNVWRYRDVSNSNRERLMTVAIHKKLTLHTSLQLSAPSMTP